MHRGTRAPPPTASGSRYPDGRSGEDKPFSPLDLLRMVDELAV
jgi:hypothetical protein